MQTENFNTARESESRSSIGLGDESSQSRGVFNSSSPMKTETEITEERTIPEAVGEPIQGREVWDADSIPFEVAERIVRNRMLAEMEKIKSARETYLPQIKLDLVEFSSSAPRFRWSVQPEILKKYGEGETLDEALARVPKFKTPEEEKAEKIAELRAQITALEKSETK